MQTVLNFVLKIVSNFNFFILIKYLIILIILIHILHNISELKISLNKEHINIEVALNVFYCIFFHKIFFMSRNTKN